MDNSFVTTDSPWVLCFFFLLSTSISKDGHFSTFSFSCNIYILPSKGVGLFLKKKISLTAINLDKQLQCNWSTKQEGRQIFFSYLMIFLANFWHWHSVYIIWFTHVFFFYIATWLFLWTDLYGTFCQITSILIMMWEGSGWEKTYLLTIHPHYHSYFVDKRNYYLEVLMAESKREIIKVLNSGTKLSL